MWIIYYIVYNIYYARWCAETRSETVADTLSRDRPRHGDVSRVCNYILLDYIMVLVFLILAI